MKAQIKEKTHTSVIHNHKLLTGVTSDKFAILLDDGKTTVFISDKSQEAEISLKYKMLGQFSKI